MEKQLLYKEFKSLYFVSNFDEKDYNIYVIYDKGNVYKLIYKLWYNEIIGKFNKETFGNTDMRDLSDEDWYNITEVFLKWSRDDIISISDKKIIKLENDMKYKSDLYDDLCKLVKIDFNSKDIYVTFF